jgi:MerR family transcriptional regulator/heat shock protein HspR
MKKKRGYFSISAVSHMLDIHPQTIRMYEKSGFIQPKRSDGNTRMFSDEDILILEQVIHYTNKLGVNLAGVEIILKMQKKLEKMQQKMNNIFSESKNELIEEQVILEKQAQLANEEIARIENYKKKQFIIHKNNTGDTNNEK